MSKLEAAIIKESVFYWIKHLKLNLILQLMGHQMQKNSNDICITRKNNNEKQQQQQQQQQQQRMLYFSSFKNKFQMNFTTSNLTSVLNPIQEYDRIVTQFKNIIV